MNQDSQVNVMQHSRADNSQSQSEFVECGSRAVEMLGCHNWNVRGGGLRGVTQHSSPREEGLEDH